MRINNTLRIEWMWNMISLYYLYEKFGHFYIVLSFVDYTGNKMEWRLMLEILAMSERFVLLYKFQYLLFRSTVTN